MDTPRSDSPLFRVPVAELDDHRLQPHSLPRSNTISKSTEDIRGRSEAAAVLGDAHSPISRDYEHAIVDDDGDNLSPHSDDPNAGRYSIRFPSRASSRSPSPPNSVNAFANPEHRRRVDRSATITSQSPSELALGLRRTVSRRPTFTNPAEGSGANSGDEGSQKAEEDVCFPPPEETRIRGGIDFEEMDEFVVNQNRGRANTKRRKMSSCSVLKGERYFAGMQPKLNTTADISKDDDARPIVNEKEKLDPLAAPVSRQPRVSNPDRFSFFSSEMDSTIHAPEIGDLLCDGENFHELFRGGQGVWWLDCFNPTNEELSMLMKAFAIHPLTAEDIRVQETREKVELFRSYYFVCFRSFVHDKRSEDFMEPVNIYIIVFREGVLSFHFNPCPHSANVRKRIRQLRDYVALSSDWICYALM